MFVALRTTDRSRVTSLAAAWDERLGELRQLAASGQLRCPGCEQLLWFRIGIKRRRHFAHRHLADCPLAHQSPELLEARAQLFKWLETKYGGRVQLEVPVGASGQAMSIDLVVEPQPGSQFAYWVFDRQQRSRQELLAYGGRPAVQVHFIHTQSTLVRHSASAIALNASQRDFISASEYDGYTGFSGDGHLHFLDVEEAKLRIYRGLRCVHAPNLFAWVALREEVLSAARISPKSGEIVVSDDVAAREEWKQKLAEQERARQAREAERARRALAAPQPAAISAPEVPHPSSEPPGGIEKAAAPSPDFNGPFRCEDCGLETTKWSSADPSAGTCVCRNCAKRRHQRLTATG